MQKILLTIVLATLCLFFNTKAQFYKPSEKTIRIGETLPDSFYQTIHQAINAKTGKTTTIQLQQYKNKLIILDFWATWCKPCIGSLINLDSTQKVMKNKGFIIVPVTYQNLQTASTILNRFKWDMTSIVGDTTLARIFPHSGIPYQIWIKDGKVIANPQAHFATSLNIEKTIKGIKTDMPSGKKTVDISKPLWQSSDGGNENNKLYQSSIASGIPGYAAHKLTFSQTDSLSVLNCVNILLFRDMFYRAFEPELSKYADAAEGSGFLLEVSDSLKKIFRATAPLANDFNNVNGFQTAMDEYIRKYRYSYSLAINKVITKDEALKLMQQDLNRYFGMLFGIEAIVEKRPKKMVILGFSSDRQTAEPLLKTKGGKMILDVKDTTTYKIRNVGFKSIFSAISAVGITRNMAVIDNTGLTNSFKVDFDLPFSLKNNLLRAQKHLAAYGLNLTIEEWQEPTLVIREKRSSL